jgi:hypothetical protein
MVASTMSCTTSTTSELRPIISTTSNHSSSSSSSSSSTKLLSEDDEDVLLDIALAPDISPLSCTLDNISESGTSRTLSVGSCAGTSHSGSIGAAAPSSETQTLRAHVESLRQQLAERDTTVNQLQRQIQQDKRHHDKLQQKWKLFFGSHATTPSPRSNSSSTSVELGRLHEHLEQLERDKNAALSKAVQLSVALAESRAAVSTLQDELEEARNIIQLQHNNTSISMPAMLRIKRQSPSTPVDAVAGTSNDRNHPVTPTKQQQQPPFLEASSPLCITDIQLEDDDDEDPMTSPERHGDDQSRSMAEELESESLSSWSQRPCLGYFSERSDYSSRRTRGRNPNNITTRLPNQTEPGSNSYQFTSSLRGFLRSGSLRQATSPAIT